MFIIGGEGYWFIRIFLLCIDLPELKLIITICLLRFAIYTLRLIHQSTLHDVVKGEVESTAGLDYKQG